MNAPKLTPADQLPEWVRVLEWVTVDDVVRVHACRRGVLEWLTRRGVAITAAAPDPLCWSGKVSPLFGFDFDALRWFARASNHRGTGRGVYGSTWPDGRGSGNATPELFCIGGGDYGDGDTNGDGFGDRCFVGSLLSFDELAGDPLAGDDYAAEVDA